MSSALCGGTAIKVRRRFTCPVCHTPDARIIVAYPSSLYYATVQTCVECGDSWSDGYRLERPFLRGWREKAKTKALADWEKATDEEPIMDQETMEWVLP